MQVTMELIKEYIADHQLVFSPMTQESESSRIWMIRDSLDGDAPRLYTDLKGMNYAPYTIKTIFVRVAHFWNWAKSKGYINFNENPYHAFRHRNKAHFKKAYTFRPAKISFEEAWKRVNEIRDPSAFEQARFMLFNGLRYTESKTVKDNEITGKGSKIRSLYGVEVAPKRKLRHRHTFRKYLAEVGLKPHDLRKAFATHLAGRGMGTVDLCKVMGWASFETASSYIAARSDRELSAEVKEAIRQLAYPLPKGSPIRRNIK